jgi:hypothetical protein
MIPRHSVLSCCQSVSAFLINYDRFEDSTIHLFSQSSTEIANNLIENPRFLRHYPDFDLESLNLALSDHEFKSILEATCMDIINLDGFDRIKVLNRQDNTYQRKYVSKIRFVVLSKLQLRDELCKILGNCNPRSFTATHSFLNLN